MCVSWEGEQWWEGWSALLQVKAHIQALPPCQAKGCSLLTHFAGWCRAEAATALPGKPSHLACALSHETTTSRHLCSLCKRLNSVHVPVVLNFNYKTRTPNLINWIPLLLLLKHLLNNGVVAIFFHLTLIFLSWIFSSSHFVWFCLPACPFSLVQQQT